MSDETARYVQRAGLTQLSDEEAEELDKEITREEVMGTIRSLKPAKTPGGDGLPVELYQRQPEMMMDKLLEVFAEAESRGKLPYTMLEALVVMVPEPGKDPWVCVVVSSPVYAKPQYKNPRQSPSE